MAGSARVETGKLGLELSSCTLQSRTRGERTIAPMLMLIS